MILLEFPNKVMQETLSQKLVSPETEKPDSVDVKFADFDSVLYHISNPNAKNLFLISISLNCFKELVNFGVKDLLKREYGDYLKSEPEPSYDVTLEINLDSLPAKEELESLIKKISLLKRNCLAAPFEKAMALYDEGLKAPSEIMNIPYRDNESIFVQAFPDRIVVIFSTIFTDATDVILGKVFLHEFVDARKTPGLQNAPQVLFSKEPPLDLKGASGVSTKEGLHYVSFVLFPRHFDKKNLKKRENTINLIQTFRDYLHYHIKCSKAYLHSRMRSKVSEFLKILNRAKPELPAGKKLASGRTFNRK